VAGYDRMGKRLETLLEPLNHSPLLPEIAEALRAKIDRETQRRAEFYRDMTPEDKTEFIDGEVVMHSPARNAHLDVTSNLSQLLLLHVRKHKLGEVKVEKCLCVFPRNDYEPDIVFFGQEKSGGFTPETMKFPIPDFVVEVLSESTEARDRGVKFEDYAAHGVAEYWIVDAENQSVEQYLLKDGDYALEMKATTGEIRSRAIQGFAAPLRAFFDPDENLAAVTSLLSAD